MIFLTKNNVLRYEIAMVNPAAIHASAQEPGGTNLRISFFGEAPLDFVPREVESSMTDRRRPISRWQGQVSDEVDSSALFAVALDTTVSAAVDHAGGRYRITSTGISPYHFIWQEGPE